MADGRKVNVGQVFAWRMTNAQKRHLIASFEEYGSSVHSRLGSCVGVILEHCHSKGLAYRLTYCGSGYLIEKLEVVT